MIIREHARAVREGACILAVVAIVSTAAVGVILAFLVAGYPPRGGVR